VAAGSSLFQPHQLTAYASWNDRRPGQQRNAGILRTWAYRLQTRPISSRWLWASPRVSSHRSEPGLPGNPSLAG